MNNPHVFDKAVLIQGNRTPAPPLNVGLPGAGRWLSSADPSASTYVQTLGNGRANIQVAKSPGTRGAGFAGGAAPNSPFTLTIHGGGKVEVLGRSPGTASFGAGQKPYPAPAGNAGLGFPVAASTYHIQGGGAALINGLAAVSGDVISYGKHYTPGQPLPGYALRGNPSSTTDIVDSPIVVGTGLTIATTDSVHTLSMNAVTRNVIDKSTVQVEGVSLVQSVTASLAVTSEVVTYVTGATFNATSCAIELATATKSVITSVSITAVTASTAQKSVVTAVTLGITTVLAPPPTTP